MLTQSNHHYGDRSPDRSVRDATWKSWRQLAEALQTSRTRESLNVKPLIAGLSELSKIAQHDDINSPVSEMDQLTELRGRWKDYQSQHCRSGSREALIAHLGEFLFVKCNFAGNETNYYRSSNHCLDRVIELRTGSPILLSSVYLILARDCELIADGIQVPGHFCVGIQDGGKYLIIDAFNKGRSLEQDDVNELIRGTQGEVDRSESHFRPASPRTLVTRVAESLLTCFRAQERWQKAAHLKAFQIALWPESNHLYRDFWEIAFRLGLPEAGDALEVYKRRAQADNELPQLSQSAFTDTSVEKQYFKFSDSDYNLVQRYSDSKHPAGGLWYSAVEREVSKRTYSHAQKSEILTSATKVITLLHNRPDLDSFNRAIHRARNEVGMEAVDFTLSILRSFQAP